MQVQTRERESTPGTPLLLGEVKCIVGHLTVAWCRSRSTGPEGDRTGTPAGADDAFKSARTPVCMLRNGAAAFLSNPNWHQF